jgi:hypothetical protein
MSFRYLPTFATAIFASVLMLQGCASMQTNSETLQTRAQAYWKARVEGDLTAAFAYEELPARKKQTLQQYARGNPPVFLKAEVRGVQLTEPGKGLVTLDVEMRIPGLFNSKPIANTWSDEWIIIDDNWYHKYKSAIPGRD